MNLFKSTLIATSLVAAGFAGTADAASKSTTFKVKIKITESCEFSTAAGDVTFDDRARSGNEAIAEGNLQVLCTPGTPYTIALNQGVNGTSVTDRKMKKAGGTDTIPYGLYTDAGRTQNWGNTTGTTHSDEGTGIPQNVPVFGKVEGGSSLNVSAGNYSDTIRATITY